jgi:hypothetical protein
VVAETMSSRVPDVIALTLLDASSAVERKITRETKVWVCVRNKDVNRTHPDIVSVPTQRIPQALAEDLADFERLGEDGAFGATKLFVDDLRSNDEFSGHDATIYAVESLLSRKLGISSELERKQVIFSAALRGIQQDFAVYRELGEQEELRMLNLVVWITRGSDLFQESTTSYSSGRWIFLSNYFVMLRTRDATRAGVSAQDALRGVCVDGLCISSTYDILASYLGGQPEIRRSAA